MDPFETLGLPRRYDIDPAELERRYRELQRALHPDRHMSAPASQRRMTLGKAVEVNEAYRVLRDELSRAQALLTALGGSAGTQAKSEPADPELLMEVMELREALSEAKHTKNAAAVHALAEQVRATRKVTHDKLVTVFASLAEPADESALRALAALVSKLKYYERFLDEVRVIEDEAQA